MPGSGFEPWLPRYCCLVFNDMVWQFYVFCCYRK